MSTLAKLYESPLETARQFALVITGMGAKIREKQTYTAHDLALKQVYAGRPVYATCTANTGRMHIEATEVAESNTKIYFLPWAKTSIYRVRPKPGNPDGVNENLLFTPNLDGCMVTIDGKPESPTVYHANAAGLPFSLQEEQAIQKAGEFGGEMENRLKIQKMADNLGVFKKILPKTPPPDSELPAKTAEFNLLEYGLGTRQVTTQNAFGQVDIEQEVHYGAVFGVRKEGAWTFYKQSFRIFRKEQDVKKPTGFLGLGKGEVAREKIINYSVVDARKFWP